MPRDPDGALPRPSSSVASNAVLQYRQLFYSSVLSGLCPALGLSAQLMALVGYFRISRYQLAFFDLVNDVREIADVFFDYRLLD